MRHVTCICAAVRVVASRSASVSHAIELRFAKMSVELDSIPQFAFVHDGFCSTCMAVMPSFDCAGVEAANVWKRITLKLLTFVCQMSAVVAMTFAVATSSHRPPQCSHNLSVARRRRGCEFQARVVVPMSRQPELMF